MKVEVALANAFVADDKGGNPAGVIFDAGSLNSEQMQSVASQLGVSETAFLLPSDEATYQFRFFTPTVEVPLCGHATIAAWWLLHNLGLKSPGEYNQKTSDGTINILLDVQGKVFMEQPAQELKGYVEPNVIVDALGIRLDDLRQDLKPQIMQRQLMVGLDSEEVLHNLQPDLALIKKASKDYDFYGFHVYALSVDGKNLASVRNFCPRVGIDEDAATGTGNGSFLEYLRHYKKLPEQDMYQIEQGRAMGRRSLIYGKFQNGSVWIGGTAVLNSRLMVDV